MLKKLLDGWTGESGKSGGQALPGKGDEGMQEIKSRIMARCEDIESSVLALENTLKDLSAKLSDAIRPTGVAGLSGTAGMSEPPSPLIEKLDNIRSRLRGLENGMKGLLNRIDI